MEYAEQGNHNEPEQHPGQTKPCEKGVFPEEVLVDNSSITALMMTLLEFIVFGIFMAVFTVIPGVTIVYFPLILFIEFILVLGLSFALHH